MKGFVCGAMAACVSLCASAAGAADIKAKVSYLDFLYANTASGTYGGYAGVGHPDFNSWNCGLTTGLVQSTLVNRKPVYGPNGSQCIAGPAAFASWFKSVPGINVPVRGTLTLSDIGGGVHQYTNPAFYPLDGKGFNTTGDQSDQDCSDGVTPHNFAFTMQAHWTGEVTSTSQYISITADDDTWLFVNNHLIVDLGGVHGASTGSYTFSIPNMVAIGISLNQPVAFDLFHAERHTCASTFTLTTTLTP